MKINYKTSIAELIFLTTAYSLFFVAVIQFLIYPIFSRDGEQITTLSLIYFCLGFVLFSYVWLYRRNYTIEYELGELSIYRKGQLLDQFKLKEHQIYIETTPLRLLLICEPGTRESVKKLKKMGYTKRYTLNIPRKHLYQLQKVLKEDYNNDKITT